MELRPGSGRGDDLRHEILRIPKRKIDPRRGASSEKSTNEPLQTSMSAGSRHQEVLRQDKPRIPTEMNPNS